MTERWRWVKRYKGLYRVSSLGRVRSVTRPRCGPFGGICKGRLLKQSKPKDEYPTVGLSKNGRVATYRVHQLVLEAFVGSCPEGMECCHYDGNKSNNRLDNLRWDTKQENCQDTKRYGRQPVGEKHQSAKLSDKQIAKIRRLYSTGLFSQYELGKMFGVNQVSVSRIVKFKTRTSCLIQGEPTLSLDRSTLK